MKTMLAAKFRGANRPLSFEETAVPVPRKDYVLLEVKACGVCGSDLTIQKGDFFVPLGTTIGHEIAGTTEDGRAWAVFYARGKNRSRRDPAMSLFRLDDKVALATGAARGIGAAITRMLAAQGARVAAADLDLEQVSRVAAAVGTTASPYAVDVGRNEELRTLVETVARDFGRIDILVNDAAICPRISFADSSEHDWERTMNVNARSQFFLMQTVRPVMKRHGGGRIVNIATE
jgi:NADPH:quinone reductase-like Zn-dependent oxidoreductase